MSDPRTAPPDDPEFVYVEELPELISMVPPVVPGAGRSPGQDTVFVRIRIDREGRVREAMTVSHDPPLETAAMHSVVQWRFRPARSNHRPIASWITIPVWFDEPAQGSTPGTL
jgi:TonB family protein